MPQFGALLVSLAGKAGIKKEDETLKKILGFAEVAQLELPDEFSNALEQKLLTEDSARANVNVRSKIIAEALNGIDSELDGFAGELEFDDTVKGQIKGIQKNTNEKLRLLRENVKNLVAEKGKGSKKDDAVLQAEIKKLNDDAAKIKSDYEKQISDLSSTHSQKEKDWNLKFSLVTKPLPKNGLPAEVNILTAKHLVEQEMAKQGISVKYDAAGNATLKRVENGTEMEYFVNNKPVTYSDFIDGVLAQNKFVQINDPTPPNPGNGGNSYTPPSNTNTPVNKSIVSETMENLAKLGDTV